MTTNNTLTIPHSLYERARQIAQSQNRDIADVVAEALAQGLPTVETLSTQPEREREKEAFHQLHSHLRATYPDEYVAIYEGQLVDHDTDRVALLDRIDDQYPGKFVLIRQVREEPEIVYAHRSIRWS